MTVGQLAREAGVTVRTLQFYDQSGLLHPSAKGNRNRRLYSQEDRARLYRILCGRYMGRSLDEIREDLKEEAKPDQVLRVIADECESLKVRIGEMMQHLAVLRNLESMTEGTSEIDWVEYAEEICYFQEKWSLIWQVNRAVEKGEFPLPEPSAKLPEMNGYYELVAETLQLMKAEVPPESQEAGQIMARYHQMIHEYGRPLYGRSPEELLHIDPALMELDQLAFSRLWEDVERYMKDADAHYAREEENKNEDHQG